MPRTRISWQPGCKQAPVQSTQSKGFLHSVRIDPGKLAASKHRHNAPSQRLLAACARASLQPGGKQALAQSTQSNGVPHRLHAYPGIPAASKHRHKALQGSLLRRFSALLARSICFVLWHMRATLTTPSPACAAALLVPLHAIAAIDACRTQ